MNETLKPYLARSLGLHAAGLAAFLLISPRTGPRLPQSVYTIDFVGPSAPAAAAAAANAPSQRASRGGEITPLRDPDAISRKTAPRAHGLPPPSLLAGEHDERADAADSGDTSLAGRSPAATPAAPAAAAASARTGAGVTTDLPNFPYPWYITQVRLLLWEAWQGRRPALDAGGVVGFSILPDGSFTDLSVESSSGDAGFDAAAVAAVRAAAPFPPLPQGFHDHFLKIHLTLTSEARWH
ncbi:MAG: TonB family protein [Elusimicrobia bacterium]|nr:TonB family protein [Elusimicrobiota bacterium]